MTTRLDRRRLLRAAALGAAALAAPSVLLPRPAQALAAPRRLRFENLHTGESAQVDYWADGDYRRDALRQVDRVLRDHRTGEVHAIDPRLLDLLHRLRAALGTEAPYQIISGYRSPRTNAMLASASGGVARDSLHTVGVAVDVRVPGRSLAQVRDAARGLQAGGVGFYPRSDFVHVDIGRVRFW